MEVKDDPDLDNNINLDELSVESTETLTSGDMGKSKVSNQTSKRSSGQKLNLEPPDLGGVHNF